MVEGLRCSTHNFFIEFYQRTKCVLLIVFIGSSELLGVVNNILNTWLYNIMYYFFALQILLPIESTVLECKTEILKVYASISGSSKLER